MAEDVIKVPVLNLEIPKPKKWDFVALAVLIAGVAAAGVNIATSGITQPGTAVSTNMSLGFVLAQMTVCLGSLMVLGKTAKEGTIHGNLFSVGGMMIGLGGVLLAAALWAAA
jgi:hypothetical protein